VSTAMFGPAIFELFIASTIGHAAILLSLILHWPALPMLFVYSAFAPDQGGKVFAISISIVTAVAMMAGLVWLGRQSQTTLRLTFIATTMYSCMVALFVHALLAGIDC